MKRGGGQARRRAVQLGLVVTGRRGGYRANAGRKRLPDHKRTFVAHRQREALPTNTPVHVTVRLRDGVPKLRKPRVMRWIRRCIQLAQRACFRVVHYSVLSNHLHLIVEADNQGALSRGMKGLNGRLAKRLNQLFGLGGALVKERFHSRALRSPREVRWALQYCLNNARRHAAKGGWAMARGWVDPYSSAASFDGWVTKVWTERVGVGDEVARAAASWLLRTGWRRGGGLDPNAIPGVAPPAPP